MTYALPTYRLRPETTMVMLHASHTVPGETPYIEHWLDENGRRLGLLGCGYHFVIPRAGPVIACRPHTVMGTHCRGANHYAIGVCLEGGSVLAPDPVTAEVGPVPLDNFTPDQKDNVRHLMDHLRSYYGPGLPLVGHSEHRKHHTRQCPPLNMEELRAWPC